MLLEPRSTSPVGSWRSDRRRCACCAVPAVASAAESIANGYRSTRLTGNTSRTSAAAPIPGPALARRRTRRRVAIYRGRQPLRSGCHRDDMTHG